MIIIIINQLDLDETMPEVITTLNVLLNLFNPALDIFFVPQCGGDAESHPNFLMGREELWTVTRSWSDQPNQ